MFEHVCMASTSTRGLRLIGSDELTPSGESMRRTLAGFPTGVAVVAAQIDDRVVGLSASSLESISLEPPLVSLSFAPRAEIDAGDHVLTLLDVHRLDRTAGLRPLVFFDSTTHYLSH
jgi:hypothetical protein